MGGGDELVLGKAAEPSRDAVTKFNSTSVARDGPVSGDHLLDGCGQGLWI